MGKSMYLVTDEDLKYEIQRKMGRMLNDHFLDVENLFAKIGMKFESGKALVTYVKAYALQTKKEVRVDPKSKGSKTRVILCTEEICPFKIVAYKSLRRQRRTLYKAKQLVVKELERDDLHSYRLIPVWSAQKTIEEATFKSEMFKLGLTSGTRLIEAYVEYVRSDFVAKLAELKSWKDAGRMITPRASDAFGQQTQDIGAYKVEKISDDIFHVFRKAEERASREASRHLQALFDIDDGDEREGSEERASQGLADGDESAPDGASDASSEGDSSDASSDGYNYQLCTLMLMNEYGEGLPIQQSLLETNGDWHMDRVLQHFKRVNPDVESRLKFIVVDKHLNEIRVLQAKPELGKIATQDHMAIDNLLHAMGYAQDGETYDTNMAALKDLCDRLNFGNFYDGRKPRLNDEFAAQLATTIALLPLCQRTSIRTLSEHLGIPKSSLHVYYRAGTFRAHHARLKPHLTDDHRAARMQFALSFVNVGPRGALSFNDMLDFVHMDEKWFYLKKDNCRYYLAPGEEAPHVTVQHKSFIVKVMFLVVVARPRWDAHKKQLWDGKIGVWPFVVSLTGKVIHLVHKYTKPWEVWPALGDCFLKRNYGNVVQALIDLIESKFDESATMMDHITRMDHYLILLSEMQFELPDWLFTALLMNSVKSKFPDLIQSLKMRDDPPSRQFVEQRLLSAFEEHPHEQSCPPDSALIVAGKRTFNGSTYSFPQADSSATEQPTVEGEFVGMVALMTDEAQEQNIRDEAMWIIDSGASQ
ncbi:hypothetical protein ATCC90586_001981 [Pythium insidiosum]|nr:hypothetical protein ATCC90586_001981 [Pythium insidiosum]